MEEHLCTTAFNFSEKVVSKIKFIQKPITFKIIKPNINTRYVNLNGSVHVSVASSSLSSSWDSLKWEST